jgi:hypothetical protein
MIYRKRPIREIREKKRGRPNPGPGRPGLGFPSPGRRPPPPFGHRPRCLGEGVRVRPSPLYKGGPRRRDGTTQFPRASSTASSYHLLGAPAPSSPSPLASLSLSLSPVWPPKGLCRRRESPSRHAVVLRSFWIPVPKPLLPHLG